MRATGRSVIPAKVMNTPKWKFAELPRQACSRRRTKCILPDGAEVAPGLRCVLNLRGYSLPNVLESGKRLSEVLSFPPPLPQPHVPERVELALVVYDADNEVARVGLELLDRQAVPVVAVGGAGEGVVLVYHHGR